jgi:hypothetical protein
VSGELADVEVCVEGEGDKLAAGEVRFVDGGFRVGRIAGEFRVEVGADNEGGSGREEGDVAGVVPMVVAPDDAGDGFEGDAVLFEDLAGVSADAEAGDYVA